MFTSLFGWFSCFDPIYVLATVHFLRAQSSVIEPEVNLHTLVALHVSIMRTKT